jgi:uncharacterized membrane protein
VSPVLDRTFKVGLVLKAADGVLEIIAGALLLLITPSTIDRIAHSITAHELARIRMTGSRITSCTRPRI